MHVPFVNYSTLIIYIHFDQHEWLKMNIIENVDGQYWGYELLSDMSGVIFAISTIRVATINYNQRMIEMQINY